MAKKIALSKLEEKILNQVPPDYYQKGVKKNFLQRAWHGGKLKTVFELIEKEPKRVLDVGCASGWFLSEVKRKYPKSKCVGVDVYEKATNYGRKKYKELELISADAHNLPFKTSSFDLVICTEVLEHVDSPDTVLSEIKRVLVKNGHAIIEMDTGNFLFRIAWYWWTNLRKGVWRDSHLHRFTTKKLESILGRSEMKIMKQQIFNYSMGVAFLLKKE